MSIIDKIFGSYSDREIKKLKPAMEKVLKLEPAMEALSDEQLKAKTQEFKERFQGGESLDDLLPEAFAVVREASWRVLGMKHFPVQILGGIVLHQGRIAEMKTGEGKTLVATLPVYLNALAGQGAHVVTVNDYLALRDKQWMGKLYSFLGLTVGCILHDMENADRKIAYNSDITYGTNNEFGFDYLRDNMVVFEEDRVQRKLHYCIVDEVDSILIDEARTPLIISGIGDESTELYSHAKNFVDTLTSRIKDQSETDEDRFNREFREETVDYVVDEKAKTATLTDLGLEKAERYFNVEDLSSVENTELLHHINQALKAKGTMHRDVNYVVEDGEIVIVDEFTGRLMYGRRYSDGLHQAIEAKEGMAIKAESKTLATITFQNFFRMYEKLAGMTGTAMTEEGEFREIYNMDVVEIPTNRPIARADDNDVIYKSEAGKFNAVIEEIQEANAKGQPVLVGTVSVDKSETLSKLLKRRGIKHNVLNAKRHRQESEIVAQAGRFGAVTIATNMAGRGTDIVLGGNPDYMAKEKLAQEGMEPELIEAADSYYDTEDGEILDARERFQKLRDEFKVETDREKEKVLAAGGLRIIGTERHESRRIDNQLRGRAGRQGDPGQTRFYISADDDLIRLFAGDRFKKVMETTKTEEDEPVEAGLLTRLIESAQRKVEGNNFSTRKHVLQYDDVMNKQREVIYGERSKVLQGQNLKDDIMSMLEGLVEETVKFHHKVNEKGEAYMDYEGIYQFGRNTLGLSEDFLVGQSEAGVEELTQHIIDLAKARYEEKEREFSGDKFREVERIILLRNVDSKWMDHIDAMDQLRQGISLRSVGQIDPVRAYQNEGFDMFEAMNESIREDTVRMLLHVENPDNIKREKVAQEAKTPNPDTGVQEPVRREKKIGRNDPCPCGSGKKYKNCHGKNA
ncbi:MAG: preprotein translocase subunit SecA [Tissierellia bacterium]|nr:preprotein translocase subunit SecA [Tissierellia bacterium]